MERLGFIHEKLDIKILILFVLQRLPDQVDATTLADLVLIDDGIDYFNYAECLSDLVETGHVLREGEYYKITEKGIKNGSAIESSIPYSVRTKAERALSAVATSMRRNAMIHTEHAPVEEGGCQVRLRMSDGISDVIRLELLVAGENQAIAMEQQFRTNAEGYYQRILALFDEPAQ